MHGIGAQREVEGGVDRWSRRAPALSAARRCAGASRARHAPGRADRKCRLAAAAVATNVELDARAARRRAARCAAPASPRAPFDARQREVRRLRWRWSASSMRGELLAGVARVQQRGAGFAARAPTARRRTGRRRTPSARSPGSAAGRAIARRGAAPAATASTLRLGERAQVGVAPVLVLVGRQRDHVTRPRAPSRSRASRAHAPASCRPSARSGRAPARAPGRARCDRAGAGSA